MKLRKRLHSNKWNWDEFRKRQHIYENINKTHENYVEFDHIDFENICIHYLIKDISLKTVQNCTLH